MTRTAGFVWNLPDSEAVLGVYLPNTVSIYAPATELLSILGIDPDLVTP